MSAIAVLPVLVVEPGHVAEARRALARQGRTPDATAVERLLWTARALPAALDLLADVRSPLTLADARFTGVTVELAEPPIRAGTPLVLLARMVASGVQVEGVDLYPYLDSDEARVRCRVTLAVSPASEDEGIRLVRFHLG